MGVSTALRNRLDAMEQHAIASGWVVHIEPLDVEGCTEAVGFGAAHEVEGVGTLMLITALGIGPSGRVQTLMMNAPYPGNARVVVEVEESGRYWWSSYANAWRQALSDPMTWCHLH